MRTRVLENAIAIQAASGRFSRGVWVNEASDLDPVLIRRTLRERKTAKPRITPAAERRGPRVITPVAPVESRPAAPQHAPPTC